ncbi:MAG: TRAP transporter small permease subunit, partial [Treponema sp.]|nr:TRAP transporter small permease subunit [Treponema sp.]
MERDAQAKMSVHRILDGAEEALCYSSLFVLTVMPALEAILRTFFHSGIPDSSGILAHTLLVLGLVSGMITAKNEDHLSIALVQNFSSDKVKTPLKALTNCLASFVSTVIAWSSLSFIRIGLLGRMVGFIPDKVFALALPIGYGVMAFRFARKAPLRGKARALPFLAMLLGTLCALPIAAKTVWGFAPPDFFMSLFDSLSLAAYYLRIPGTVLLIAAALAGAPLFMVMGGLSLLLIQGSWGEIDVVANQVYIALTQDSIIPIPLFTLAGFFLSESKAGDRLVQAFRGLFNWFPGGMIVASVLICA